MRVSLERETEMPDVLRLVDCLAHRAQQHGLDELGLRFAVQFLQDAPEMLGRELAQRR